MSKDTNNGQSVKNTGLEKADGTNTKEDGRKNSYGRHPDWFAQDILEQKRKANEARIKKGEKVKEDDGRKKLVGRPKMPFIDSIATQAWYFELKRITKTSSAAEVASRVGASSRSKQFVKYARGEVAPSGNTLDDIDDYLNAMKLPSVKGVFHNGPEGMPLWDALSGNFERLWDIIDHANPAMRGLRYSKVSHAHRVNTYLDDLFKNDLKQKNKIVQTKQTDTGSKIYKGSGISPKVFERMQVLLTAELESIDSAIKVEDLPKEMEEALMQRADTIKTNLLPTLESEKIIASQTSLKKPEGVSYASIDYGPLMVCSFQQLAATIALWRISMLVADSADKMDNIMNRLIKDAIPDMLRPYGVDKKVIEMIEDMQRAYKQWLRPSD